jgi:hypothetical protein
MSGDLMLSTRVLVFDKETSLPARAKRTYFYLLMSLLNAGVVFYGFSQTIDDRLLHPNPLPPWILYLHAPVFSAWVLFFILQSALVRIGSVKVHRTLGWLGAELAVMLVVLGYATAIHMDKFHFRQTQNPADAAFLIIQLLDLGSFIVPFILAIWWRKRPEYHRRLMLIATLALSDAAFRRFPFVPLRFAPVGVDVLILFGVFRDYFVEGRVHKVYLKALPVLVACQMFAVVVYTHSWQWWVRIAEALVQ